MAANTTPISPLTPTALAWATSAITTGNTALTGAGTPDTDIKLIMTAGANGARVNRVRVIHRGTNVATVMRFFVNNGSTNGTASNNSLVAEATMVANTLSTTLASTAVDVSLNMVLAAGYRLYYTIHTGVAAGFSVTCPDAGDY